MSENSKTWEQHGIAARAHHSADAIATAILDTLDGLVGINASVSRDVVLAAAREVVFQAFDIEKQRSKEWIAANKFKRKR